MTTPPGQTISYETTEWDAAALEEKCAQLRRQILLRDLATAAALDEFWPGGQENKYPELGGWIFCWGNYLRIWGKRDALGRADKEARAFADRLLTDALREAPTHVELVTLGENDRPLYMKVHPKSLDTLVELDERDRWIRRLAATREVLFQRAGGNDPEVVADLTAEILYQHKIILTVLNHPGPGSPFQGGEEATPAPWTEQLDALDVVRAMYAHHQVHRERLQAVTYLFPIEERPGNEGRGSWATLFMVAADMMGQPGPTIARDYSLEAVCAQVWTVTEAKREAYESAKER